MVQLNLKIISNNWLHHLKKGVKSNEIKIMLHTLKNIKHVLLAVLLKKIVCIDDKFSKPVVPYRGKMQSIIFLKQS